MADPYTLTIAEIRIDGDVRLTSHLPQSVALAVGQELHVNVKYRLKETTLDKEAYRFRLSSHVGDQTPPDREQVWHDRPILHDQRQGFIGHRYVFDSPGTYQGQATVLAQYLAGRWGSPEQEVKDEATQNGTLEIKVH